MIEDFEEILPEDEMIPSSPNLMKMTGSYLSGNPTKIIGNITENVNETIKFCEQQKTKRELIKAQTKVYVAQVNAQRDFLLSYLDKTFDERKYQFSRLFDVLDKGIESGDIQVMSVALQQINQLASSSPFKSLESTQEYVKGLLSGDAKLDF